MAQNLKNQNIANFVSTDLAKGIEDVINGNVPDEKVAEANQFVQQQLRAAAMKQYEPMIKEGADFLMENSKKPGIVTLDSGLQYEILTEGSGGIPQETDKVTTHYHGTLLNGQVFDSSVERGEPATFPVNGVIKGWVEALQLMPVGSKWRLFVPFNLAYGDQGAGQMIKPFSTLIFEVELLKIN